MLAKCDFNFSSSFHLDKFLFLSGGWRHRSAVRDQGVFQLFLGHGSHRDECSAFLEQMVRFKKGFWFNLKPCLNTPMKPKPLLLSEGDFCSLFKDSHFKLQSVPLLQRPVDLCHTRAQPPACAPSTQTTGLLPPPDIRWLPGGLLQEELQHLGDLYLRPGQGHAGRRWGCGCW